MRHAQLPAARLKEFNDQVASLRPLDPNGSVDRDPHGPHFGSGRSCVSCHQASGIRMMDRWSDDSKDLLRLKMVDQLRMPPPGPGLAAILDRRDLVGEEGLTLYEKAQLAAARKENTALYDQLRAEYGKALREWLTSVSCKQSGAGSGSQGTTNAGAVALDLVITGARYRSLTPDSIQALSRQKTFSHPHA